MAEERALPGIEGLLSRVAGQRAGEFILESLPPADGGRDVFEFEARRGIVTLRGSSGIAQAAALHRYLKQNCMSMVTWDSWETDLPSPLSDAALTRCASPYRYRYCNNYVAFSYTFAWWDWARWQRELDWMALHGFNLPLALTGVERTWLDVGDHLGLTGSEMEAFLPGPAYLPFGWLGCVDGWGGPLSRTWADDHAQLQTQILGRARGLGMRPVLQGFTGHIPRALTRVFPGLRLRETTWSNFGPTCFLDPGDPRFLELGRLWLTTQQERFGTDHYYAADPFIEMTPPSGDAGFLRGLGQAIYESMAAADPEAVWVMQGWPFYFRKDFWGPAEVEALLSGVPENRLLVLDLYCDHNPVWKETAGFGGQPWAWCVLHNFGGRPGMFGDLDAIAAGPPLGNPSARRLAGCGIAPEAHEQNPLIYELASEHAFPEPEPDLNERVRAFLQARYGPAAPPEAFRAWRLLIDTLYRGHSMEPTPPVICWRPRLDLGELATAYDQSAVLEAWALLAGCGAALAGRPGYRYDLVDVSRQALAELQVTLARELTVALAEGNAAAFARASEQFLELGNDLDKILGTDERFLLGPWITGARRWGRGDDEADRLEWNARMLITQWGPPGTTVPVDYAAKPWAGLVSGYYLPRWRLFLEDTCEALCSGQAPDTAAATERVKTFEEGWIHAHGSYPEKPAGDTIIVAAELVAKYR